MACLEQEFLDSEMFRKLKHRSHTMAAMVAHVETHPGLIIETGTSWDHGNWFGQGQSTLIWDWLCSKLPDVTAVSIDIRQEGVDVAKAQTQHVKYVTGNSVLMLPTLDLAKTTLLYLDSFDWTPELDFESSFHHLAELTTVWAKLPSGCMIVVDDRHEVARGKHWMVDGFMRKLGVKPVFAEYQIGWIKP
jgi:cephalosporin hydroxylase